MRRLLFLPLFLIALVAASALEAPAYAQGSCANTLSQPAGQAFWVGPVTSTNQEGAVVVFVHGYNSDHNTWTVGNYAVRDACNQGFRVAAIDLGGTSSIWANGQALTGKLQAVAAYFGVSKVNVMAHSKGGLDTQTAVVHYGAHQFVQRYIAFGTPFGGTDLADHACSWYGFWIWQCNDATWDMRPGYMAYVRGITDPRPENGLVVAYAARGSKCDWYNPACGLIAGPDDGVVPAWSVWASGVDSHIADRADLRHGEIHTTQRHNAAWLFGFLGRDTLQDGEAKPELPRLSGTVALPPIRSDYILRGGETMASVVERFPVESNVDALDLTLIATGNVTVSAASPDGQSVALRVVPIPAGLPWKGHMFRARVARPAAGDWTVTVTPEGPRGGMTGYHLNATFHGGTSVAIDHDPSALLQPGSEVFFGLTVDGRPREVSATINLRNRNQDLVARADGLNAALALPETAGTYNLDVTVAGLTTDGTRFERTLVSSVAVIDPLTVDDPATVR